MSEFTEHMNVVASEFIGTVLFVDDLISLSEEYNPSETVEESDSDISLSDAEILTVPEEPVLEGHELKINELSTYFSNKGILFSPLCTKKIANDTQQTELVDKILRLAPKADVLVIDWAMEEETSGLQQGSTAKTVISMLDEQYSDRYTLVCIFSAEPKDKISPENLGSSSVTVLYKSKRAQNSYANLPSDICSKFAEVHSGLLPSAALASLDVIRKNSQRLLKEYSTENDPAYLSHRCLVKQSVDAEIFITELISSSIGDLLRGNENITSKVDSAAIKKWLEDKNDNFSNGTFSIPSVINFAEVNVDIKLEWILNGLETWVLTQIDTIQDEEERKTKKRSFKEWQRYQTESLISFFSQINNEEEILKKEAQFSRFSSHVLLDSNSACNYSSFICLGSIVRKNGSQKYYLCIQPLCDSVRLPHEFTQFIFLSLERCKNVVGNKRHGFHIIIDDAGNDVFLKISETLSKLTVFKLKKNDTTNRISCKPGDSFLGKNDDGNDVTFDLIAQLRGEFAKRVATKFLGVITRVGIDEPEWLRRHGTAN